MIIEPYNTAPVSPQPLFRSPSPEVQDEDIKPSIDEMNDADEDVNFNFNDLDSSLFFSQILQNDKFGTRKLDDDEVNIDDLYSNHIIDI